MLRVQLHTTIFDNIFLWWSGQSFRTAFRFGKKTPVTLSICAPSGLTTSEFYHAQSKVRSHITGQLWGTSSACDQSEFAGLQDLAKEAKRQRSGATFRGKVSLSSTINLTQVPLHILAFFLCKALGCIITKQDYVRLSCYVEVTTGKHDTNTWN